MFLISEIKEKHARYMYIAWCHLDQEYQGMELGRTLFCLKESIRSRCDRWSLTGSI